MGIRWIRKVGLAVFDQDRLLVVRKFGDSLFILPGGKPEKGETDSQTLKRELEEELGCSIAVSGFIGVFSNQAAGVSNAVVEVRLYEGSLLGNPAPTSEIEEIAWVEIDPKRRNRKVRLARSISKNILPHLRRNLKQSHEAKLGDGQFQRSLELG